MSRLQFQPVILNINFFAVWYIQLYSKPIFCLTARGGSCPVLAKTHQLGHQSHVCTESAQVRAVFSETVSTPHRMLSGHNTHRRHFTHHCINAADSLSRFRCSSAQFLTVRGTREKQDGKYSFSILNW